MKGAIFFTSAYFVSLINTTVINTTNSEQNIGFRDCMFLVCSSLKKVVAVGLHLGSPLCRPHLCHHCGSEVDRLGHHGLSCRKSEGRHYRHAAINDIVHRALSSAQVPSRLEPSGLSRSDGKRPDGVTMVPWENGKPLVWDATCPDTLASSYQPQATSNTGAVASLSERRKSSKYCYLISTHHFKPVAIDSLGAV